MYVDDAVVDTAGRSAGMVVSPDKLLRLKRGFEDERDRMRDWLSVHRQPLVVIPPPGNDPCSRDTMALLGQNGQAAVDAAAAYLERLNTVIDKLHESALEYGLVEDEQVTKFAWEPT